jgi:hypothetical protein
MRSCDDRCVQWRPKAPLGSLAQQNVCPGRLGNMGTIGALPYAVVVRPLAHHVEQAQIETHRLPLVSPGA